MTSRKRLSTLASLPLLALCAFTLPYKASTPHSTRTADDERAIRQLNEECLKAHNVGDAITLDRIEDADFTISGDLGVVSKQQHLDKVRHRTGKPEVITRKIDPQQFRFYNGVRRMP